MEVIQSFIDQHPVLTILGVLGLIVLTMALKEEYKVWREDFKKIPVDLDSDDVGGGV